MIVKSTPFFRKHGDIIPPPKPSPPPIDKTKRNLIPFKGSKEVIQNHEQLLKELIITLEDIIPEQYKMKIEGCELLHP